MVSNGSDEIGPLDFNVAKRLFKSLADESETGTPTTPASNTPDLESVGDYQILRPLGKGGSGTVYLARRFGQHREVALKLLRRSLGDEESTQRAWRELDLLRRLQCPEIPKLHDYGEHAGYLYIVYDFIEGQSLNDFATRRPSMADKVRLLIDVAHSLQRLHELGVIHRDIKPSNILVDSQQNVFFVDFGLATQISFENEATLTSEGQPIGTPAYMAPEMARGEHRMVTTRSDVYSLGATAYKLLTGTTVHDMGAPFHEVVRRVAQEQPRDPAKLNADVPKALAAVLRKAVDLAPENRYATALEFASDLQRWLDRLPVEAMRITWPRRTLMAINRHRVASVLVLMMVALLGVAMFAAGVAKSKSELAAERKAHIDEQSKWFLTTIVSATKSMDAENYSRAHQTLMMLDEAAASGRVAEDVVEQIDATQAELILELIREVYGEDLESESPELQQIKQILMTIGGSASAGDPDPVIKGILKQAKKLACAAEMLVLNPPISETDLAMLETCMTDLEIDYETLLDPQSAPGYDPDDLDNAGQGNDPPGGGAEAVALSLKEEACIALDEYCNGASIESIEAARSAKQHVPALRDELDILMNAANASRRERTDAVATSSDDEKDAVREARDTQTQDQSTEAID